ncbi:P-loop containing nucleoside triphosphate hydrolase protein [Cubamyces menziesii]|nr:P-loop containing nucleoside triphosphate hydrolase protein [Cubamyces menziesii]
MQPRVRFNAKARGGSHKKKAKRGKDEDVGQEHPDPNAPIVIPKSEEEREKERKLKMREEMLAGLDSKANSKKKKRLDKYIEKKLKQEERLALFEKLSKSQAQASAALQLKSSATLGTGKPSTHLSRLEKQEDLEVKRAMDGRTGRGKRRRHNGANFPVENDSDESDEEEDTKMDVDGHDEGAGGDEDVPEGTSRSKPVVIVDSGFSTTVQSPEPEVKVTVLPSAVGSALRHNPDGTVVAPKISKKPAKRAKGAFASWKDTRLSKRRQADAYDSDSSFDSSDSAYDSASEEEQDSDANDASEGSGSDSESALSSQEDAEVEEPAEEDPNSKKRKRLGFKEWAMKQLSAAKGYVAPPPGETNSSETPASEDTSAPPVPKKRKMEHTDGPREMRGPLGEDLHLPQTSFAQHLQESAKQASAGSHGKTRKVVSITRPPEVEEARLLLPIVAEEQPIMEAILLNSVVIICGETGSGKTTQVPQFLYEAGFGSPGSDNPGMIGVTQPRRVAAMSMASRVAHELSLTSTRVSYQIRYDATVSPSTAIKFMTDGVLLRELATDFLLKKYSVIIIDEAHERSMNTDILIGVLSRVVKLREEMWKEGKDDIKPLRLIIMSATLRVADFAENKTLFSSPPPIINVPARQHPVTVHFSRRTSSDYVTEAIKKASKIHARLPPGGILIFLTGQNEITGVCRKLEARYGKKALEERRKARTSLQSRLSNLANSLAEDKPASAVAPAHADVEAEDVDLGDTQRQDEALAFDVDGDVDAEALDSDDEAEGNDELGIDAEETDVPMHIVPLYALLSSEKQMQVFRPPPPGTRLVVVATNVAETSLTIPGIRYVVDCGRAKERRYDIANGIQAFQVSWISKASAAQRAGRAGRTGPGHCYRLYSSALFENYFDQFSQPEILRMPIEGVVLQMKSMHIDAVVNFPFPTPPDRESLQKAEKVLTHLGALAPAKGGSTLGGSITDIGRTMSLFPLSPRFSRMLVSGRQHGCLPYVITIVSALSVGDPFLREESLDLDKDESDEEEEDEEMQHLTSEAVRAKEARRLRRKAFFQSQALHAALGNSSSDVLRILSVVGAYEFAGGGHKFCEEHFVRPKAMEEIHKLRAQISSIVQTNFPDVQTGFEANLRPPSALQLKVLRQLIAAGFIDQVAVRKDIAQKGIGSGTQFTTSRGVAYQALGIPEDVFIHPSSVLANQPPPDYVVYLEVVRTSRVYIKGVTVVNGAWLSALGKSLCTYSKPFKNKEGQSMVIPHFGPQGWELPPIREDQK